MHEKSLHALKVFWLFPTVISWAQESYYSVFSGIIHCLLLLKIIKILL